MVILKDIELTESSIAAVFLGCVCFSFSVAVFIKNQTSGSADTLDCEL